MVKNEKKMVCQPIDDNVAEMQGGGYSFYVCITQNYDENEWEQDSFDWYIYPNGTFTSEHHYVSSFEPSEHYHYGGKFDESKYNDYVEQMKQFREDWEEELQYDDDQYEDYSSFKIHMVFDVKKYEEEFLNK